MKLQFAKMHGVGNDVVVLRWPEGLTPPDAGLLRRWADRRRGIGFDQLLLLAPAGTAGTDASYKVFNADGVEVEQCGNGVRCLARFLFEEAGTNELSLESPAGVVEARLSHDGEVRVNLGTPDFDPASLPFEADGEADRYRLQLDGGEVEFGAVSIGNPHVVIQVHSLDAAPVGILGPELERHPAFPRRVNVGFMELERASRIRLRVFERGVGETPACGTGAAAAVAVGQRWGLLGSAVDVSLPGGVLNVEWAGPGEPVWLSGPATRVYEGQIEL